MRKAHVDRPRGVGEPQLRCGPKAQLAETIDVVPASLATARNTPDKTVSENRRTTRFGEADLLARDPRRPY